MDTRSEIREFLTSRRARITPEQTGLPTYGARRVPGLRREEVAVLAGVSVPYYTRLERGDMSGVSESVLEALARALQLDDAERAHLFDLARAAQPAGARPRRRQAKQRVRPEVQWILDAITGAAAFVGNDRLDILAANQLGRALFSELYAAPARPVNTARFVFLDPRAETFYADWDRAARETVAILRSAAGRDPHDRDLSDLVGELATQSEAFRTHWAAHNVRFHANGRQALPPPRRRRAQPQLQPPGPRRRPRADDLHLRRRARLPLRGGAPGCSEAGRPPRTRPPHPGRPDVHQRPLGRTGVSVSKLCLGAMMFGSWGNADHDESIRIIHAALDAGINFIDTADVYGPASRRRSSARRSPAGAATTSSSPPSSSARWARTPTAGADRGAGSSRAVEDSLRRLDTDWIDLYQVHRPDPDTDIEETRRR